MATKKKNRFFMRTAILLVLAGAIGFTLYNNATKENREVLQVGDPAPDFKLTDLNGEEHQLSDYKGQGVFVNFWGTWCKPCEKEFPLMERQYQVYKDQGVQILAVNIAQSDFEVKQYAEQRDLTFPIVIDKNKSVMEAYNIIPLPTTLLVNAEGNIEKIITGEMSEEDIQSYMEQIKPI
ncbi:MULTISPECIES: thiol-disulfide oxidoreductase ResA [Planococcus]|uniref:Thiol-disulfide oxidoreductase ResA n=1 Tax=Planococcus glaciei TaxID=459472 RepID=A0A7H8QH56_9BACL|nr:MULTISPECIES: thiol-disulfide oxidoreductase ResA [Planococcus]QDY46947.1 thiol-disulfide oxidoreductase ResA [Planococcus glaciei]QKX52815.1 thiol-disulfide oxidoreductase ResA [Planococcus glaciei]